MYVSYFENLLLMLTYYAKCEHGLCVCGKNLDFFLLAVVGQVKVPCSPQLLPLFTSGGSWSKFFDPGQVSHPWFGFGKFPLKKSNFSIFSLGVKKNIFRLGQKVPQSKAGRPLIYCGSKISSGRVRAHLYFLHSCDLITMGKFSVWVFLCNRRIFMRINFQNRNHKTNAKTFIHQTKPFFNYKYFLLSDK